MKKKKIKFHLRRYLLPLVLLILVGVGGVWYWQYNTPEAQIRRLMAELCSIASKPAGENAALGVLKINRTDKIFAPSCRIDVQHQYVDGSLNPSEITSMLARYRPLFAEVQINMRDMEIMIGPESDQASVYFTGILRGTPKKGGGRVEEVRDLFCRLKKIDDHWRISEIAIREVLEK